MAAFKVVQEITSLDGNATSGPISLKSGYLRITPAGGDAFVSVGSNPTATDNQSIFVPIDTLQQFLKKVLLQYKQYQLLMRLQQSSLDFHQE